MNGQHTGRRGVKWKVPIGVGAERDRKKRRAQWHGRRRRRWNGWNVRSGTDTARCRRRCWWSMRREWWRSKTCREEAGKIDNKKLGNSILKVLGSEFIGALQTIGTIIIIIIIHGILKNITEGLENKSISKIVYYVQYILIVTVMMSNFTDIITMVKDSISNLVGFSNSLIPILITLVAQ